MGCGQSAAGPVGSCHWPAARRFGLARVRVSRVRVTISRVRVSRPNPIDYFLGADRVQPALWGPATGSPEAG